MGGTLLLKNCHNWDIILPSFLVKIFHSSPPSMALNYKAFLISGNYEGYTIRKEEKLLLV